MLKIGTEKERCFLFFLAFPKSDFCSAARLVDPAIPWLTGFLLSLANGG